MLLTQACKKEEPVSENIVYGKLN
ncbi:MAG: hypothetical protein JWR05_2934, partial [Mucilaginibacter sp.]|nr:hypothetical protein [Mucilaginibacter sp.]